MGFRVGTVIHRTLVVTYSLGKDSKDFKAIYRFAKKKLKKIEKDHLLSKPVVGINCYTSFCIFSCGSKYGWREQETFFEVLQAIADKINEFEYEDGSSCFEYFLAEYGSDFQDKQFFVRSSNLKKSVDWE